MAVLIWLALPSMYAQQAQPRTGHYLFAWTGDVDNKGKDFLAVIDADPSSPSYGHLVTTVATDQQTVYVHHTEYTMPASGMLFANDHDAGRTFIFDVRDALHPTVAASFTEMAGYMHPHSFQRLPNGHVLATFQHTHHGSAEGNMGMSGGLVEIDDRGKLIRANSNADPALPDALLTPYSLVVLPELDRIISTNSSMDIEDIFRGVSYQLWRLSDLKLLKTEYFDVGENRYAQISPEEPASRTGWIDFCANGKLRDRAHYRGQQRPAEIAAGIYTARKLVRRPHHRWTLSGAERAGGARSDCARHQEWSEAGGGLTLEDQRNIQTTLDRVGCQDTAVGSHG
ncbi:MAG: hypothetical protein JOY93_05320 [Acidobacteriales bacterium]|nr:hypothetical protein [Terriglobales bacterium]